LSTFQHRALTGTPLWSCTTGLRGVPRDAAHFYSVFAQRCPSMRASMVAAWNGDTLKGPCIYRNFAWRR
jgi:hypothetical protein